MSDSGAIGSSIRSDINDLVLSVSGLVERANVAVPIALSRAQREAGAIIEDLAAMAARDPAAHDDQWYCYRSSLSFRALLTYRVAHAVHLLHGRSNRSGHEERLLDTAARLLSENAKVRTGVEIHPSAVIGRRMVIDHGWGTVIGEDARIGDDCYFLQNVVLGGRAIGIVPNTRERRHPSIGDRVVIAGGVYVFGAVTVGDDCRIDAGARITTDIPAGSRVRLRTVQQVLEPGKALVSVDRVS